MRRPRIDLERTSDRRQVAILFVRAGGDPVTGRVRSVDLLALLRGYEPERGGVVTPPIARRAAKHIAPW